MAAVDSEFREKFPYPGEQAKYVGTGKYSEKQ